jgi:hypothetical protein
MTANRQPLFESWVISGTMLRSYQKAPLPEITAAGV